MFLDKLGKVLPRKVGELMRYFTEELEIGTLRPEVVQIHKSGGCLGKALQGCIPI